MFPNVYKLDKEHADDTREATSAFVLADILMRTSEDFFKNQLIYLCIL